MSIKKWQRNDLRPVDAPQADVRGRALYFIHSEKLNKAISDFTGRYSVWPGWGADKIVLMAWWHGELPHYEFSYAGNEGDWVRFVETKLMDAVSPDQPMQGGVMWEDQVEIQLKLNPPTNKLLGSGDDR